MGFFADTFDSDRRIGVVATTRMRDVIFLRERAAEWCARMAHIEAAREFLYVSTYYVQGDRYGLELIARLADARRRGVRVVLVTDAFGQRLGSISDDETTRQTLYDALDELSALGASVRQYSPPHLVQRRLAAGHHIKIQISDRGRAIFGSSNFTASSFERWNELSVEFSGDVVVHLLLTFESLGVRVPRADVERLTGAGGELQIDYAAFNPCPAQTSRGPIGWRTTNAITLGLVDAIDAAERSVRISSFYFKPCPELRIAIRRARDRGVRVSVYHSGLTALRETKLAWLAAAADYNTLLRDGVEIYESARGEHSKLLLIDDVTAVLGSYNLEYHADDRLAEAMLASREPAVVDPVRHVLDRCEREMSRVDDSWPMQWRARLMHPVRRWF